MYTNLLCLFPGSKSSLKIPGHSQANNEPQLPKQIDLDGHPLCRTGNTGPHANCSVCCSCVQLLRGISRQVVSFSGLSKHSLGG